MRVAYLAHDLADAAVERRVAMLRRGGAEVDLFGFRRSGGSSAMVAGVVPRELGTTQGGALGRRVLSLVRHGATVRTWAKPIADADVIVARNLDNLLLAALARRLGRHVPLVYELLDVHTIMFKRHPIAALLRALERRLLRVCDAVIISSPAFEREYLARFHPRHPPTLLIENKVLTASPAAEAPAAPRSAGPPWRIGWFGGIRCRPSLDCLSALLKAHPGLFEVHVRGRFVEGAMGDVQAVIRDTPGMFYHGPYKAPDDLARIYGDVHFAWAIDFFQEGANSEWLLPNRLYEGGLYGAVPIALRSVETGRWLQQHGLGLLVDLPLPDSLLRLLKGMTQASFLAAQAKILAADRRLFQVTDDECKEFVGQLSALQSAR